MYADQLSYISLQQAQTTVNFLKQNNIRQVILWCACCNNEKKQKLIIRDYKYAYTGYENYYTIKISGRLQDGSYFYNSVDLAYVWINYNNQAVCLGSFLNFPCDPCSQPFAWDTPYREDIIARPPINSYGNCDQQDGNGCSWGLQGTTAAHGIINAKISYINYTQNTIAFELKKGDHSPFNFEGNAMVVDNENVNFGPFKIEAGIFSKKLIIKDYKMTGNKYYMIFFEQKLTTCGATNYYDSVSPIIYVNY